ncbi:MAG: hypothetical protein V3S76_00515 [Candidatus Bipolaricaulota bacterium]
MKKLRHKILRVRLALSKNARARFDAAQEQQRLIEISLKAHQHHEREQEALAVVSEKAATHDRTMKVVVTTEGAQRHGDEILLSPRLVPASTPCTEGARTVSGSVHVEEATISGDQFQNMLDERHAGIKQNVAREYQERGERPLAPLAPETTAIDPTDALHFMMTGKVPVSSQDELEAILKAGGFEVEEVELTGDDAAAMLYLTGRNNRK